LCKTNNALLIVDEIQSGYGRTGKFFAHQHFNCTPHLITVAKGMGNGFPVAGVLIHPSIPPVSKQLGTTFGGNHLACAAAKAVLETIHKENLIVEAEKKGNYLIHALKQLPLVNEVRGKGLMIGLSLSVDAKKVSQHLLYHHNIFTGLSANPNTLRLLPPLTISIDEIEYFLNALENTLKQFEFASETNELAVV
jgi:acetylornithine aminotransferase